MTLKVLSISFSFALLVFTRCGGVTGQSGDCERTNPMLHFLFLVYDRVHNGDLWNHFFAGAPANAYSINIQYSKKTFLKESWPASLSEKSEIGHYSKKTFRYARYVHASDNLLMRALNRSRSVCDQFLLLSADAVPIVKFDSLYTRFVGANRVKDSSLCITDSGQWIKRRNKKSEYYVKHHNWWVLNKENATYAHRVFASMASRNEREEDLFGKETDGYMSKEAKESQYATEEFWHYKVLFGNFDTERPLTNTLRNPYNLQYPSEQTRGIVAPTCTGAQALQPMTFLPVHLINGV